MSDVFIKVCVRKPVKRLAAPQKKSDECYTGLLHLLQLNQWKQFVHIISDCTHLWWSFSVLHSIMLTLPIRWVVVLVIHGHCQDAVGYLEAKKTTFTDICMRINLEEYHGITGVFPSSDLAVCSWFLNVWFKEGFSRGITALQGGELLFAGDDDCHQQHDCQGDGNGKIQLAVSYQNCNSTYYSALWY